MDNKPERVERWELRIPEYDGEIMPAIYGEVKKYLAVALAPDQIKLHKEFCGDSDDYLRGFRGGALAFADYLGGGREFEKALIDQRYADEFDRDWQERILRSKN